MLHFVFCLHAHQPVGNFGFVLEKAYEDAYLPLVEVLERRPRVKVVLHYSGILLRWFEQNRPDFIDRLARLAAAGRIEFLGGGFYEPVLSVIPQADRLGQMERMSSFIARRFGSRPRGLWLAERVWEPGLPLTLAQAGFDYVVLDDYHLRAAGVTDEEMVAPRVTGDGTHTLAVIGGSERLRYYLPYEEPGRAVDFLKGIHQQDPARPKLVTMADDGEKFGVWPGTHRRVFQEGWLERFFDLLEASAEWLRLDTFSGAMEEVEPGPPVYLPTVSYMELSEWALPPAAARRFELVKETLAGRPDLGYTAHFLRGGYWRNFLSKYPESRYLLGRMHQISRRLAGIGARAGDERLEEAREELWQGQCNDGYWHGVFGGLYLPFLRAAISEHLIKAERILDEIEWGGTDFGTAESADLDGDGREEVLLGTRHLAISLDQATGAAHELAYKPAAINLFNSLSRREESYHRRLSRLGRTGEGEARSIHQMEGMRGGSAPPVMVYDEYPRLSLVDHVRRGPYTLAEWGEGRARGGWDGGRLYNVSRWGAGVDDVHLELEGPPGTGGVPGRRKRVSLERSAARLDVSLRLEGDREGTFFLGQEFNLTPTSIQMSDLEVLDDRGEPRPASEGEFPRSTGLLLADRLGGFLLRLTTGEPVTLWLARVATVSNSEAGYEQILQQIAGLWWKEAAGSARLELRLDIRPLP